VDPHCLTDAFNEEKIMYDPDALYSPTRCVTHEEREKQRHEYREMHARWLARQAPIIERDRRWRRRLQAGLGALCLLALTGVGLVVYGIWGWLNGAESQWLAEGVSHIKVGTATTVLAVARMWFAYRRRQRGNALVRTVDATTSILPGR
jgi:hypothetical protein